MKKLLLSLCCAMCVTCIYAQVGINTQIPQSTLDVNGSIQLRDELRVNNQPGTPGQIYFAQVNGSTQINDWKNVNIPFLEEGQYQLVNTFAKKDQLGIDWVGTDARVNVFTETFEADSPTKAGWTQVREAGTSDWNLSAAGSTATVTFAHGGVFNARFVSNATTQSTKLISPALNFSSYSSNLVMSFWYLQPRNSTTANQNYLTVHYRTSAGGAWSTAIASYTADISSWTQVVNLTLPNSAGAAYYQIAFDGESRGSGRANAIDDIEIYNLTTANTYQTQLSNLNELITTRNWVRIPGMDLPVKINNSDNKISVIYQTGVESRLNPTGTGVQVAGNVRYLCGLFRRQALQPVSSSILVAVRADQIDNYQGTAAKSIPDKSQSLFTLTYVVEGVPADEYIFSIACRRLSRTGTGSADNTSLFSIGNSITQGNNITSDFMMKSILKMDVIELVTVTN